MSVRNKIERGVLLFEKFLKGIFQIFSMLIPFIFFSDNLSEETRWTWMTAYLISVVVFVYLLFTILIIKAFLKIDDDECR